MFGILNLHKPSGYTSRDVVNRVARIVRPAKAGHAGTLDPLATGVLIVCVGPATRLIEYVQRMAKTYRGTFLLGRTSDSDDVESEVRELAGVAPPTPDALDAALPRFVGKIAQRPPAYSAKKIAGRRAYQLARAGEHVELPPNSVEIYNLAIVRYEYPELELAITCSGGTYVRSVGRDLAVAVGSGAVMSALVRTGVGDFKLEDAITVAELDATALASNLLPPLTAVADLPRRVVTSAEAEEIRHGRFIDAPHAAAAEYAAVDRQNRLVAILTQKRPGKLGAVRNFAQS